MTRGSTEVTAQVGYDATHERVYPREYLDGIVAFNAGRYYDAHEIWEAIWLRSTGDTKLFYHTLIQAAVALYHRGRGNAHGARTLYARACEKLDHLPPVVMSLDVWGFASQFHTCFAELTEAKCESFSQQLSPMIHLLPLG
jgi:predicted metal-dependent hydrolase